MLLYVKRLEITADGERKMKKVIASIIFTGLVFVPIASQAAPILSPGIMIPEPTAFLFIGFGLLGLAGIARKQLQE